jgi:hypothetical protein
VYILDSLPSDNFFEAFKTILSKYEANSTELKRLQVHNLDL